MQDPNTASRLPNWKILTAIAATVVIAGGSTVWWTWQSITSTPTPTVSAPDPADPVPDAIADTPITAYWLEDQGTQFALVPIPNEASDLPAPTSEVEWLALSFEQLLTTEPDTAFSAIPPGTEILDVTVESDGVHVDLSSEFTQGGGSAAMQGRLGQVIFTASGLDSDTPVWISVDGSPLELLGGEGLVVDQPMTRSEFEQAFPL